MWLVTQNPDKLLQMHNREHPVGLYHRQVRQLHNASPGANYVPSRTPTAPDVTGRPKKSSTTRTTAFSHHYHPEGEVSTGASKQGPRD